MKNFTPQIVSERKIPFATYVSISSLARAKDLSEVLDNFSFSSSLIEDDIQTVSLRYVESDSVYTLGWYTLYYDRLSVSILHFATANFCGFDFAHEDTSHFAAKMHLLRKNVSGLGSLLFSQVLETMKQKNITCCKISSEATSVGFYDKMAEKYANYFSQVKKDYTRYADGGCDFLFICS